MAWIESHQELKDHPKTLALCELLGAERPQVVGYLHLLWWWCIDYASDGSLKKFTNEQIAKASEWKGNAKEYVTALRKCGFIDRHGIHDWHEFTLHYNITLEKKERQREQVRERVKRWRNAHVTQSNAPTRPDLTRPNHTKPLNTLPQAATRKQFVMPTPPEVTAYAVTIGFRLDGEKFCAHYESNGWKVGRNPMKNWKAAVVTWKKGADRSAMIVYPPPKREDPKPEECVSPEQVSQLVKSLAGKAFP